MIWGRNDCAASMNINISRKKHWIARRNLLCLRLLSYRHLSLRSLYFYIWWLIIRVIFAELCTFLRLRSWMCNFILRNFNHFWFLIIFYHLIIICYYNWITSQQLFWSFLFGVLNWLVKTLNRIPCYLFRILNIWFLWMKWTQSRIKIYVWSAYWTINVNKFL